MEIPEKTELQAEGSKAGSGCLVPPRRKPVPLSSNPILIWGVPTEKTDFSDLDPASNCDRKLNLTRVCEHASLLGMLQIASAVMAWFCSPTFDLELVVFGIVVLLGITVVATFTCLYRPRSWIASVAFVSSCVIGVVVGEAAHFWLAYFSDSVAAYFVSFLCLYSIGSIGAVVDIVHLSRCAQFARETHEWTAALGLSISPYWAPVHFTVVIFIRLIDLAMYAALDALVVHCSRNR